MLRNDVKGVCACVGVYGFYGGYNYHDLVRQVSTFSIVSVSADGAHVVLYIRLLFIAFGIRFERSLMSCDERRIRFITKMIR